MAAGLPPGLGMSAPPPGALPSNPFSSSSNGATIAAIAQQKASFHPSGTYDRPENVPRIYSRATLLAYSSSPLSIKSVAMGSLREWYGEWEPFHHKSTYYNSRDNSRRGGAHAEDSAPASHPEGAADGGGANNGGGLIGGALGGFAPRREGAGARFGGKRNEDRERGEGLRIGEVPGRRGAPAGKNPFGQISASGTFKPAGVPRPGQQGQREALEGIGENRRFGMGERSTSFGKDRMREALPEDRRGQRERFSETRDPAARDRRRGADRAQEGEDEDADLIESPRMRRAGGGADQASDWRKPGDRERTGPYVPAAERRAASDRKGSTRGGPTWMADADDNPAWMDDDSEAMPVDNRAPFGQFGTRRRDDANGQGDLEGAVDSIQAFKAQMKERERRERQARGESEPEAPSTNDVASSGPPPGLGRDNTHEYPFGSNADRESEMESIRNEMIAAANQRSTTGGSLYDSISNSHEGQAQGAAPPGLPGRSSRFARFFDGKGAPPRDAQAAALAAQQKMLESMGGAEKKPAAVPAQSPPVTAASASINIADLFGKTSVKDDRETSGKDVSQADQQSMQKLMAMLQGGVTADTTEKANAQSIASDAPRPASANRLQELLGGGRPSSTDSAPPRNESAEHLVHQMQATDPRAREPRSSSPQTQQITQRSSSVSSAQAQSRARAPQQQQQPQQQQSQPHQQQHAQQQQPSQTQMQSQSAQQQQQPQQQHQQYPQYQQPRSSSPGMAGSPYGNDPRMGGMGSPVPGGFGGYGGSAPGGRPPPPGMDPRMMGRPPVGGPGFQQMPPHIAAAFGMGRGGPVPPPGMGGSSPFPGFAPFPGGRPALPPGMPPQMYQQLMSMPPHIQQQVLSGQGFPPRSPYDDRSAHSPGGGVTSPSFPYYAQSPPPPPHHQQQQQQATSPQPSVGSHAMNGANLMALLSAGRNTPSNSSS